VGADLTAFPLYVYLDPSEAGSGLASKIRNDGYDIRFTSFDGETEIPYEREGYSESDGNSEGHFWVKTNVADGDGESATDIYMYYGYAEATDGSDASNVWTANYQAVWHMAEDGWDGTEGEVIDSIGSHNGAAVDDATTTATNAKIYRCGILGQVGDYINFGDQDDLQGDNYSFSFWGLFFRVFAGGQQPSRPCQSDLPIGTAVMPEPKHRMRQCH